MPGWCCRDIGEKHRRLAEITEMIHTASLVHDDVLDECSIRRGERNKQAAISVLQDGVHAIAWPG